MKREWKPGDVAVAKYGSSEEPKVYLRVRRHDGDERWVAQDGHHSYRFELADWWRPLVVIDPEDREQVERLADIFCRYPSSGWVEQMQDSLREFANPTPLKPGEPTGLGAVVEDANGLRWTRVEYGEPETRNPWYPALDCSVQPAEYDEITAVRVLSEGVQA